MFLHSRALRTSLLYLSSPAALSIIAMIVVMRPLTAYADGFHGPEEMWRDLKIWALTGELWFPSWRRACRGHLPHPHRAKAASHRGA